MQFGTYLKGKHTLGQFSKGIKHKRGFKQQGRRHALLISRSTEKDQTAVEEETYDVYVQQAQPLQEGIYKHIVSVFVADEQGMINRVAGVFARRGTNIESLAVGLTQDQALFTIVVNDSQKTVETLCKQLLRLVSVRYVEDTTAADRIDREMLMLKVRAPGSSSARAEVLQTCEIFRGKVVDVSDATLTVVLAGDPGKCTAFFQVISKFEIIELARTGRVTLKRGQETLEPARMDGAGVRRAIRYQLEDVADDGDDRDADVYAVDHSASREIWDVNNVLDVTGDGELVDEVDGAVIKPHTLSIDVQDSPGVLNVVTGVFARRGYNVQSLAVGTTAVRGLSRIIMVVPGKESGLANLIRQVEKLVCVRAVKDLTTKPYVYRELMLIKVRCSASQLGEIRDLTEIFRGQVVDVAPSSVILQMTGRNDKMMSLQQLLQPYGVLEVVRTGRIALERGSGVDSKWLDNMNLSQY